MKGNDSPVRQLDLQLQSTFEELERAVNETETFVARCTEDDDLAYRVVLALSEAVTNCIEHGNKNEPEKLVLVSVKAYSDGFVVGIEDQGEGFDPEAIDDPLAEENLLKESGRGLYLMDSLSDNTRYAKGGRRVVMEFHGSMDC